MRWHSEILCPVVKVQRREVLTFALTKSIGKLVTSF